MVSYHDYYDSRTFLKVWIFHQMIKISTPTFDSSQPCPDQISLCPVQVHGPINPSGGSGQQLELQVTPTDYNGYAKLSHSSDADL